MASGGGRALCGLWCRRVGWLLVLWLLGVGALGALVLALKFAMRLAGLAG